MESIIAEQILNAPVQENGTETDWLATLTADLNNASPDLGKLVSRDYQELDATGNVKATYTLLYTNDHTKIDVPEHLYQPGTGKNVISVKGDATDRILRDMALVRGGSVSYLPLPSGRDKAGFPKVDARLASKVRKGVERLAMTDKASANRFDYRRFTVLPVADGAPSNLGGYLRIVFVGTRVK